LVPNRAGVIKRLLCKHEYDIKNRKQVFYKLNRYIESNVCVKCGKKLKFKRRHKPGETKM